MAMKCDRCGSEKVYRSRRQGLKEGLWLRCVRIAPYRCHECGNRFYGFKSQTVWGGRERSFAAYLGLAGKEYKIRQWLIMAAMTLIFLAISVVFLLHTIDG